MKFTNNARGSNNNIDYLNENILCDGIRSFKEIHVKNTILYLSNKWTKKVWRSCWMFVLCMQIFCIFTSKFFYYSKTMSFYWMKTFLLNSFIIYNVQCIYSEFLECSIQIFWSNWSLLLIFKQISISNGWNISDWNERYFLGT